MPLKVSIEHLSKIFTDTRTDSRTEALSDINLEIYANELLCVVGPSGCGKTTLLRIVAGLEMASHGEVFLDGHGIDGPSIDRGMVFQEFAIFPWRTVTQNIAFGPEIAGIPLAKQKQIIDKCIKLVSLDGCEQKYPFQLSGGMKQRLAIARTLATDPEILLMDEPFGSLDARTRDNMQMEMLKIWHETRKTIIFVTHNIDEAIFLADRIVIMTDKPGRINKILDINMKHPRDKMASEFIGYKKEILLHMPQKNSEPFKFEH